MFCTFVSFIFSNIKVELKSWDFVNNDIADYALVMSSEELEIYETTC